jgi:uncharacterized phage infection (PIP) family protein YhgE
MSEQAGKVANDVKQQASQVKDQVAEQAESRMDDQKQRVVSQMSTLASALDDVSSSMRDTNPQMAHFAESAVDRLNQWSSQLERKDFGQLVDDVESFARRNPALFVGGAFALGLLGARFLKSSAPTSNLANRTWSQYSYRPYDGYEYSSGRYSSSAMDTGRPSYRTPMREGAGYDYDTRTGSRQGTDMPSPSSTRDYTGSAGMTPGRSGRDSSGTGSTPSVPTRDYSGSGTTDTSTRDYSGTSTSTDVE